jgi:hypothetical protein
MKLPNPRHENFAQLLAQGVRQSEAFVRSGFRPGPGNASNLAHKPHIQQRIAELQHSTLQRPNGAQGGSDTAAAGMSKADVEGFLEAEVRRGGPSAVQAARALASLRGWETAASSNLDEKLNIALASNTSAADLELITEALVERGVCDVRIEEFRTNVDGDTQLTLRPYYDGELRPHESEAMSEREKQIHAVPPLVKAPKESEAEAALEEQ